MMKSTNTALIQELRNSNDKVFEEIYDHYSQVIYRNILKLVPQKEEAEDILQVVFQQLWENRQQLKDEQQISGWLFSTSFHKSMEYLRKSIRIKIQEISDHSNIPDLYNSEGIESNFITKVNILGHAINQLPERKKKAFQLCKIEGKSYGEAASILGISEDSVKDYVKVAMGLIRKHALKKNISVNVLLAILCS